MFDFGYGTTDSGLSTAKNPGTYVNNYNNPLMGVGIWFIIALVLAIVGGILVHFLFVKAKDTPKNKFLKWLKDFLAFKTMWIETIIKILYYIVTIFVILMSFSFISMGGIGFLMFICTLILGPIAVRLVYEGGMMFIMIWRNTKDIAENTEKKK